MVMLCGCNNLLVASEMYLMYRSVIFFIHFHGQGLFKNIVRVSILLESIVDGMFPFCAIVSTSHLLSIKRWQNPTNSLNISGQLSPGEKSSVQLTVPDLLFYFIFGKLMRYKLVYLSFFIALLLFNKIFFLLFHLV